MSAVSKTLNRVPPLLSSVNVGNSTRYPARQAHRRERPGPTALREGHSMALAVNQATDFFTSTIPAVAQRVKPVGFDEEPCTLTLADGYSYARVQVGDSIGHGERYEVIRKLGWGLYATTWLVRDQDTGQYHALKIVNHYGTLLEEGQTKNPDHPRFHEREILDTISFPSACTLGSGHCMKLLESFHIERDTGKHLCLVMELGGMSLEDVRPMIGRSFSLPTALVKSIIKQLCLGLEYLHDECGVIHTDIKPSNVLVAFNDDDTRHLVELTLKHIPIERYPPRKVLGEEVEAIRSQPLPLPPLERRNPLTWIFKLTDFGSAQWIGQRTARTVQPIRLRAPEVVVGRDWNEKIDIWSLGCLAFEFLTGRTLFRADGGLKWRPEDDLLANHLELLSLTQFPSYFYQNSRLAMYHLKEDGSLRNVPGRMMYPKSLAEALGAHKHACINQADSKQELDLALSFIARCLTVDPQDRPSANQLLSHPWIRNFELGNPQSTSGQLFSLNSDKARTIKV